MENPILNIKPNQDVLPSRKYLFDKYCTGRIVYRKGTKNKPEIIWRVRLPNYPPMSAESTVVFDNDNNIYFGCHDGAFYSFTSSGIHRWTFKTGGKIYSSPLILENDEGICFASGDGFAYCLDTRGVQLWNIRIGQELNSWFEKKHFSYYKKNTPVLHEVNRISSALSWASPNKIEDILFFTGYGLGVSAIDWRTGKLIWRNELGKPSAHLTGVVIDDENNVYAVSQQTKIIKLTPSGKILWRIKLKKGYNTWGNPSYDPEQETIYVPTSHQEDSSIIYAISKSGALKWFVKLKEATRGAVTVTYENHILVNGYNGKLYFLDKMNGAIIHTIQVTNGHLWTTSSVDPNGNIFTSVIDSDIDDSGRICCFDKTGKLNWDLEIGKCHSVPVLDKQGKLYISSWRGEYYCIQT